MTTMYPSAQPSNDPIRNLESRLAGTLRPVAPSNDFVSRLRGSIHLPQPQALNVRDWHSLLLALLGVLGGFLALVLLARAIFHLLPGRREE